MSDTAYVSEPHRLIVHEHPEDGFEILHPDSCDRYEGNWPNGLHFVNYDCAVAAEWDVIDYAIFHGFADDETYRFTEQYVLLPGVYTLRVEIIKYRSFDAWGGYEYDSTVWIDPQAALPSRPPDPRVWSSYAEEP